MMTSVLQTIVAHKRTELANTQARKPLSALLATAQPCAESRRLEQALRRPVARTGQTVHLITEIKPASPSAGVLATGDFNLDELVGVYDQVASAFSVLTDERYFGGSLGLLERVRALTPRPLLRKDFIVDPYQVVEARAAGADAVLLIVKSLDDDLLARLHRDTLDWGMTPVVEVNTADELARVAPLEPSVLLINNRNLDTLAIDLATTEQLAPITPPGWLLVSASGVEGPAEIARLRPFVSGFLIGTALMKAHRTGTLDAFLEALTA